MKVRSKAGGWRYEDAPKFKLPDEERKSIAAALPAGSANETQSIDAVEKAVRLFLADIARPADKDVSEARVLKHLDSLKTDASTLAEGLRQLLIGQDLSDRAIQELIEIQPTGTQHPGAQLPDIYDLARGLEEDLWTLTWCIDELKKTIPDFEGGSTKAKHELTRRLAFIWKDCTSKPPPRTKGEGPWPAFLEAVGGVQVPKGSTWCELSTLWSPSYELKWYAEQPGDKTAKKVGEISPICP